MSLYRVFVKGVVLLNGRVPLLLNERDELELPGGRLEVAEQPQACVVREVAEELGQFVRAEALLDAWVYEVLPGSRVPWIQPSTSCVSAPNTRRPGCSVCMRSIRCPCRPDTGGPSMLGARGRHPHSPA